MTVFHHTPKRGFIEIVFAAIQIALAKVHAMLIAHGVPINHALWAAVSIALIIGAVVWYKTRTHCKWWKAIKLGLVLLLIRFVLFTPFLNLFRHKRFFYLGKTSAMDKMLYSVYPETWSATCISLIFLL